MSSDIKYNLIFRGLVFCVLGFIVKTTTKSKL
jgi:hypothetical protein